MLIFQFAVESVSLLCTLFRTVSLERELLLFEVPTERLPFLVVKILRKLRPMVFVGALRWRNVLHDVSSQKIFSCTRIESVQQNSTPVVQPRSLGKASLKHFYETDCFAVYVSL